MFASAIRPTNTADTVTFQHRAGNCILITIAVVCVCILVACGVMIVREYALGIGYAPTLCKVANITTLSKLSCKYCDMKEKAKKGKGTCVTSEFPCAQIHVNYTVGRTNSKGILHPDSIQATGHFGQCSYEVCLKTLKENQRKVDEFKESWRQKGTSTFSCYYNVNSYSNSVILMKKHTKQQVIHSMLWPSVVILICGSIFFKIEVDRRKLTCCGVQGDSFCAKSDGRACNGKNQNLTANEKTGTSNVHRSLEHLSNYNTNNTDYNSLCSKSLPSLEKLGTNGKSKNMLKKQLLPTPIIQTSCSDTGVITNKLIKSHSDEQGRCLIPEITIDECGSTTESLNKSHNETPV